MSLGTPTGNARMAAVAIEVPPLPAMPRMPPSRPAAYRSATTLTRPSLMTCMARALSLPPRSSAMPAPPARGDLVVIDIGPKRRIAHHAEVNYNGFYPARRIRSRAKWNSSPLVSRAPTNTTGFGTAASLMSDNLPVGQLAPSRSRYDDIIGLTDRFYNDAGQVICMEQDHQAACHPHGSAAPGLPRMPLRAYDRQKSPKEEQR